MTHPTTEFFEELAQRKHEPLLGKVSGTARLELSDDGATDHWFVEIEKGDVTVSHRDGPGDLTLRAEKKVFDGLATGEVNAVSAFLRGDLVVEGNWELMVVFQRIFPSPPTKPRRRATTTSKGKKR